MIIQENKILHHLHDEVLSEQTLKKNKKIEEDHAVKMFTVLDELSEEHTKLDEAKANRMTKQEAEHLLSLSKLNNTPTIFCPNKVYGCNINSFKPVVDLHFENCQFSPKQNFTVIGKLNFFGAHEKGFRPFCSSFDKDLHVLFLYKLTKNKKSVRICAQHYTEKKYNYSLTFLKAMHPIYSIHACTGLDIHQVPDQVFAELGHSVKFRIVINHQC